MKKLEVFFDYACPFCMRGHAVLLKLIQDRPDIEVVWRPCEAHPRPERYGPHSDLLARGFYYVLENGGDIMKYHELMYHAALNRGNIESPRAVAEHAGALADSEAFFAALSTGAYLEELAENNRLCWGELCFPAVPSYRCDGRLLKAVENVGVKAGDLEDFIK